MGAWIEIILKSSSWKSSLVAPFMGAWIEINKIFSFHNILLMSHPLWVRGLKYQDISVKFKIIIVAPFMGAWIEIRLKTNIIKTLICRTLYGCVDWNPSQGIKAVLISCRTLYGCVDWNALFRGAKKKFLSRTLYGCVDWNTICTLWHWTSSFVAPFMGAWIEMANFLMLVAHPWRSHPLWVRGLKFLASIKSYISVAVAPFMGAWIEMRQTLCQYLLS